MNNPLQPVILAPNEGKRILVGGSSLFLKLFSEATGNRFSITEYELSPHFPGPPAHQHKVFEHAWYVLEGDLTIQLGDRAYIISRGGFVFIPNLTVHAFSNNSDAIVKVLVVDTPGGFEDYYDDLQTAFADGKALDHEKMREIQLKYDTYPSDHTF